MSATQFRQQSGRHARSWAAILALLALIASSFMAVSPAQAVPETGYVGVVQDSWEWTDTVLEGQMVVGVYYSAQLTGPPGITGDWEAYNVPAGLSVSGEGSVVTVSGTPEEAGTLELVIYSTGEVVTEIVFSGAVEPDKDPSSTVISAPATAPFTAIPLEATVTGTPEADTPTGQVEFWAGGTAIASGTLDEAGVATVTASVSLPSNAGVLEFTAKYLGDEKYAPSESDPTIVRAYISSASGVVLQNDVAVSGALVELLSAATVVDTDTTGSDGTFTLNPGTISSTTDADKLYVVRVTYPDSATFYYGTTANITEVDLASEVGPLTWKTTLQVKREVAPVWSDTTLVTPRKGSAYSDSVTAVSPTPVTYSVTAGSLPAGLSLTGATGAVEGTPSCDECAYDFTVTADNGYGSVTHRFTGTVLRAGIAPTWTDVELADLQATVPVDDGVEAAGDPTIVYSVTAGTLPAGLSLASATGAITGTPTSAGPYSFEITATNDYGTITTSFTGEVAAAPEIDLTLRFAAGTPITDAASVISADGLKVGSTYTLTMYSTPVVLYTGIVGPTGGFTWTVALPADTPAGAHRLVLSGIAPDGSTMTAEAWFTLLANGTIGAISYTGPLSLAATGADPLPTIVWATVLLMSGAALCAAGARRRRRV